MQNHRLSSQNDLLQANSTGSAYKMCKTALIGFAFVVMVFFLLIFKSVFSHRNFTNDSRLLKGFIHRNNKFDRTRSETATKALRVTWTLWARTGSLQFGDCIWRAVCGGCNRLVERENEVFGDFQPKFENRFYVQCIVLLRRHRSVCLH